ncbi:MAG: hypothetical protein PGN13_11635 [Patulibacter minatonensis]
MHRLRTGAAFLATPLVAALAAGPTHAAEPIMSLSDVRPGMQCAAISVIQGSTPVSFGATVLGVTGGPRASDASIIMRFSGAAVEGTGIGQGFSGSPVSCPDDLGVLRVVGAIATGVGQYDNTVAGVTPIEAMLATPTNGAGPAPATIGEPSTSGTTTTKTSANTAVSTKAKTKAKTKTKVRAAAAKTTARAARPASARDLWLTGRTPLTLSGVRGPLAARLARVATAAGIPTFAGSTAGRADAATNPGGLAAGDAVAVSQVTGDVSAGAIGTVTYVDGDRVWAFGHPYSGTGATRLLMQQASITTVIASPNIADQVSYKLGTPGASVGTVGFDGAFAIGGFLGPQPAMIDTDVTVKNAAGAVVQTAATKVVDDRSVRGSSTSSLLALAAGANAGAAIQRLANSSTVGGSARVCTTITLKGEKVPLYQCADSVVATPDESTGGIESGVAQAVAGSVSPALSAERFTKLIERVHVDVTVRDEADSAEVVRIRKPKALRAGKLNTIRVVVVQGSTGERREVPLQVRIPKSAAGQRTGIAVLSDPVEAVSDDTLSISLFGDDSEDAPPPKNLPALRALYTPAGISGLRVLAVPGVSGRELVAAFSGDETPLDDDEVAALQAMVKVAKETPTVTVSGAASVDVRPTR